ncbi:trafficking protein particle complex subunit 14 isoform X2 [Hemicordylus capensis]|uniref:trafficking protein particle complex subunit 14 isoform X2 n=1 Tax=Hemicordylus capensis TaxID=884348 RepID=UPI002304CEF3|nr:trafficking protein particle complex subunit 14 isoform X2 [Hemicordylus capensis]
MESQCDYFMYFPAVPFPAREVLLGEPGRYRALPRRNHLYLGETVRFLLVLRCRSSGGAGGARPPWGQLAGSLSALASVSPAAGASSSSSSSSALVAGAGGEGAPHEAPAGDTHEQEAEEEEAEEEGGGGGESLGCRRRGSLFRDCRALLTHGHGPPGRAAAGVPIEEPIVSTDEVIFPLTISLDRLPPTTLKAKIVVTVWKRDQEKAEVRERGYLSILQDRSPSQTFREEQGAFKAQVSTMLTVLPPPELKCQQLSVSGKHLTVLKVLNAASQEELSVWDVRILPNLNASYLPMMPDGSVLLVDDVWLPSIRLARPRFVMTAECESPVVLHRRFTVTYTLINNLQDFLAVRLVWTPESAAAGKKLSCEERRAIQDAQDAIVCHTPLNNLGFSHKGSARTFGVTFQALRAGLYELSQHMKLKLQFTASVSNPPPEARPVSRKSSPGSPAVRELVERHQASLGRSQSFSHQQPARGHLMRSGSVMERRAITPPVGSPVGRPLYLPPDKAALSLDKIAKRECKVLVITPVT